MKNSHIIKLIKKFRKNKYQYSRISLSDSKKIKKIKNKIFNLFEKYKKNNISQKFKVTNDTTFNCLEKIFFKKKINSLDENFVEKMYHKYNYNLQLKAKYGKNFKAISKQNTDIKSYIYLALIISPNKRINFLQILNMIFKISDQVIINLEKIRSSHEKKIVSDLLLKEEKYINKIRNINAKI